MVNLVLLAASCKLELCTSSSEKPHENGTNPKTASGIRKQSGLDLEKPSPPVEAELSS